MKSFFLAWNVFPFVIHLHHSWAFASPRKLGQQKPTRGANESLMEKHFTARKNDFTLEKLLPWRKGTFLLSFLTSRILQYKCSFSQASKIFWEGSWSSSFFRSSEYKSHNFFGSSSCSKFFNDTREVSSFNLLSAAKVPSQRKKMSLLLLLWDFHNCLCFSGNCKFSSSDFWQDFSLAEEVLKLLRCYVWYFLVMDGLEATFLLSCTVWHDSLIVIWDVLGK